MGLVTKSCFKDKALVTNFFNLDKQFFDEKWYTNKKIFFIKKNTFCQIFVFVGVAFRNIFKPQAGHQRPLAYDNEFITVAM